MDGILSNMFGVVARVFAKQARSRPSARKIDELETMKDSGLSTVFQTFDVGLITFLRFRQLPFRHIRSAAFRKLFDKGMIYLRIACQFIIFMS